MPEMQVARRRWRDAPAIRRGHKLILAATIDVQAHAHVGLVEPNSSISSGVFAPEGMVERPLLDRNANVA